MLRRQARLRREYLYRKAIENRKKTIEEKKDRIKRCLEDGITIDPHLRREALTLVDKVQWEDDGPKLAAQVAGQEDGSGVYGSNEDDEYRFTAETKIVLTTSRDPSSRLKMFAKELKYIFPHCQKLNRGNHDIKELIHACRANNVTDFIMVHEHRGVPDTLVICHLPYGPTAYFTISDVIMRHDIPDIGNMSEQDPNLVFLNFRSNLGKRVKNILRFLYPPAKKESTHLIAFVNYDDYILFKNYTYKKKGKEIELAEIGPRFTLHLYQIKLGTLDSIETAETEWVLRPYMNTASKRLFLAPDSDWLREGLPEER